MKKFPVLGLLIAVGAMLFLTCLAGTITAVTVETTGMGVAADFTPSPAAVSVVTPSQTWANTINGWKNNLFWLGRPSRSAGNSWSGSFPSGWWIYRMVAILRPQQLLGW